MRRDGRRVRPNHMRPRWGGAVSLTLLVGAAFGFGPPELAGQSPTVDPLSLPRPELRAHRTAEPITLDGRLDEGAWATAEPSDHPWIQVGPDEGMPGTERTVIRVVYDDEALYVGAELFDPEPQRAISAGLEQDYDTSSSDIFGIALDTFRDRANGFLFAINPEGAVFDAQAANDQRDINSSWEGIVEAKTRIFEDRWVAEVKIPFATLRYRPDAGAQTWGANFSRRIRRRNEDTYWAALPRQYRIYKFSLAGSLTGLEGLQGGRNLWVKPFAMADNRGGGLVVDGGTGADLGVDAKWGVTPQLTLDLTANTDFSQVEVDQEQVNLDRFNLFFPERRDFFLENEGTFAFWDTQVRNYRTGSSNRRFRLFNSRAVGLGPDRRPVPILGGARLTGRAGPFEVGGLVMQTRRRIDPRPEALGEDVGVPALDTLAAENVSVARLKVPIGVAGALGGMFVNRQSSSGAGSWNRSFGIDGNIALGNLIASAYWAGTRTHDPGSHPLGEGLGEGLESTGANASATELDRNIAMAQLAWRDPIWNASALYKRVGADFDPQVGFVDRRGVERWFATLGAHPRPQGIPLVLELNPYVDVDLYTNAASGVTETRTVESGFITTFVDGGTLALTWRDRFERVLTPFTVAGQAVPLGSYDFQEFSSTYTVPASHSLSGRLSFTRGGFFDGTRTSLGLEMLYRPNVHWQLSAGAQRNQLELAGTPFTADLYTMRARYAHDTRTFGSLFVQYNGAAEEVITNARFNLMHAPLSDIFVVFTERRGIGADRQVLERGITLKVTQLLAF